MHSQDLSHSLKITILIIYKAGNILGALIQKITSEQIPQLGLILIVLMTAFTIIVRIGLTTINAVIVDSIEVIQAPVCMRLPNRML